MKIRDRHIIYLVLLVALALPRIFELSLPAVPFKMAEKTFQIIEEIDTEKTPLVFVSLDFGPNTLGENKPQAETLIEHLMRRKIRFILSSQYAQSKALLETIPQNIAERLNIEYQGQQEWRYGVDWVNIGFRPGGSTFLQQIARSENLLETIKSDARGNNLMELPDFKDLKSFMQISHVIQITSLTGALNNFIEFFTRPNHRPIFLHGCTSIVIPEAYIYLDSKQLSGLLEGVAGAAWHGKLLRDKYKIAGTDSSSITNTMISVGHLVLIAFVLLGNILYYRKKYWKR